MVDRRLRGGKREEVRDEMRAVENDCRIYDAETYCCVCRIHVGIDP